jgi:hypothetical protein
MPRATPRSGLGARPRGARRAPGRPPRVAGDGPPHRPDAGGPSA